MNDAIDKAIQVYHLSSFFKFQVVLRYLCMSKISVRIRYTNQLLFSNSHSHSKFNWDQHSVLFNLDGVTISTEAELDDNEQQNLVRALTFNNPAHIPNWRSLTPDLHQTIRRILTQIQEATVKVDNSIRQTSKGIRLQSLSFEKIFFDPSHSLPIVHWEFSKEEKAQLQPLYDHLDEPARQAYEKGITIPVPVSFERRPILLNTDEIKSIGDSLKDQDNTQPHLALYSIAWDNFIEGSYQSAILILATAIETSLKWWLSKHSDEVYSHMKENMQTPAIELLYTCARKYTGLSLPNIFAYWLVNLREARNDIAHKPAAQAVNILELARWFAVGEAIFKAFSGSENSSLVGYLVEPTEDNPECTHHTDNQGIVLRQEELNGINSLHLILNTGETYRINSEACKKCKDQDFEDNQRLNNKVSTSESSKTIKPVNNSKLNEIPATKLNTEKSPTQDESNNQLDDLYISIAQ
ncbi:hypothetical protein [Amphritea sp.]|uniref:hypothetical protein n=1 Tax=Amphritea sp. TaxID=1872502 RepID=UPI0025BD6CCB|nr:hypothetical protein [Amphritea sp.]